MKQLYTYALALSLYASASFCAVDEQEIARLQALNPVELCEYKFEEVIHALGNADKSSDRYPKLVAVGIGLIEMAGRHGLTSSEKVLWYNQLLDMHNAVLVSFNDGEVPVRLVALQRVIIDKIMHSLTERTSQTVENKDIQQGMVADEQGVSA